MGIIEKIIRHTPFYSYYKNYKQAKAEKFQQHFEERHLPDRIKFYADFIHQDDLVFDVGANVGNRVEAFLKCNARVVAVEPQPECVKILKAKFKDNIIIENVGLNDTEGELEMQISSDSTVSSFNKEYINKTKDRFKYSSWENTIKVPVTTLDKLIAKHGTPKFCKIDVEGFELMVLKGLHSNIPYLSLEYCVPEMQDQNIECLNYLHSISPDAKFNYSVGESMAWALNEWQRYDQFINHIKSAEFLNTSFGDIYVKTQ